MPVDRRLIQAVRFVSDGLKTKVLAVLDDGCTRNMFRYYPDELVFTAEELIGMTVTEAEQLYEKKDAEYLSES